MSNSPAPFQRLASENSIWSLSFQSLLWTNWLTAINDNVFRWFVIGIGKDIAEAAQASDVEAGGFQVTPAFVLAFGTASFVLPYLLFAVPAGWLADRFSKRHVIVGCKVMELVVMLLGVVAVMSGNIWFLLAVVFLTGMQSALFAPSKVGKIPELLDETKISAGNGLFNLATLTATIIGMALGGWLKDVTGEFGQKNLWLTALVLVGNSVAGTAISLLIRAYPAANPSLKFPFNFVSATIRDIAALYRSGPLFRVALGIVFYWSFAALGQLNIDTFASESGAIIESERTPMLISLVLGVGFGSVLAGIASCGKIELGLVPWAALGMVIFASLLAMAPPFFLLEPGISSGQIIACTLLAGLGISAGFFDVPLSSYLQDRSPVQSRGAVLAATNFLLFGGVLITSLCFYPLRSPTFLGSAELLPSEYSTRDLSENQKRRIEEVVHDFRETWNTSSPLNRPDARRAAEAVHDLEPQARHPLLAALVFEHRSLMRAAQEETRRLADSDKQKQIQELNPIEEYAQSFEAQDQRLVKVVDRLSAKQPLCSARNVFLLMGLCALPVFLFAVYRLPQAMLRIALWWFLRGLYRLRLNGSERIPDHGPALLIANHSSWLDGALMLLMTPRRVKAIAWAGNFKSRFMTRFAKFAGIILISGGPKSIVRGLREASQALRNGELVCVFPEGGLSRTVQIQAFKPGVMKVLEGLDVPVIPVYLDQMWGSIFSYAGGKALNKLPRSFRRPVSIHIGQPIPPPHDLFQMRQELLKLSATAVDQRAGRFISPAEKFVRACRKRIFQTKLNDSTGQKMTGAQLLMRALILRSLLRRNVFGADENKIAVLIPPSSGGVVVNMCLALDRKVSVNLNYTVSNEIMNHCIREAGIKHVLTTAKVLEKFEFKFDAGLVLLDDLREKVSWGDKITAALVAYLFPAWLTVRWLGLNRLRPHDLLTVIFTSGSTGTPKGVQLTHQNIGSNVDGIDQVISLNKQDVIAGVLPFFHSFGYTVSMWGSMALDIMGVYHFSPLDVRQVGKLVQENGATILLATPTFLRSFMKRCTTDEFKSLQVVVVGAEKMPHELADEFEKKYGFRPIEGYGATELSPLVSVNVPPTRRLDNFQVDCKEGTVGRPIANVATKVLDLDKGHELGQSQPGMLWIKGPNVMAGYLHRPDLTEKSVVDGWYNTGDVALIDEDGFIKITGRMSRFSKIGGEMVPHVTVEETLMQLIGDNDDQPNLAVTAVPDPRKGERLIVLYTHLNKTPEELCKGLSASGLPNLYIPGQDGFIQVEALPVLGTGKIDLKGLKQLALDKTAGG